MYIYSQDAIPFIAEMLRNAQIFELLNKQTKDLFEKNRNAKSIAIDNEIEIAKSKDFNDELKQKIASLDNEKSQLLEENSKKENQIALLTEENNRYKVNFKRKH